MATPVCTQNHLASRISSTFSYIHMYMYIPTVCTLNLYIYTLQCMLVYNIFEKCMMVERSVMANRWGRSLGNVAVG